MKLYVFTLRGYAESIRFDVETYEVEEKAKSYTDGYRRFLKSDIERVTGSYRKEVILLEDNPAKAAQILLPTYERELNNILSQADRVKGFIDFLEQVK